MNLLEAQAISKAYGGIRALDTCSISVEQGTIAGLIGPNGSGKTTLFNVITGYERVDAGEIRFKGKPITVIGGGDSAMEEALFLSRFATRVTIIHRRDHFRASKIMLDRARQHEKIEFLPNTVVDEVYDVSQNEVTGLKLRNVKTNRVWDFPTSAMFLGIGHIPNAKMFDGQLDADQDGYLKTHDFVFTRVPGVYACGDVHDRRYRQAITAAGSGCMAALEVEKFLEDQGIE